MNRRNFLSKSFLALGGLFVGARVAKAADAHVPVSNMQMGHYWHPEVIVSRLVPIEPLGTMTLVHVSNAPCIGSKWHDLAVSAFKRYRASFGLSETNQHGDQAVEYTRSSRDCCLDPDLLKWVCLQSGHRYVVMYYGESIPDKWMRTADNVIALSALHPEVDCAQGWVTLKDRDGIFKTRGMDEVVKNTPGYKYDDWWDKGVA